MAEHGHDNFDGLMPTVASGEVLGMAVRAALEADGWETRGADGLSVPEFLEGYDLEKLADELMSGGYQPGPLRPARIPKGSGYREINIPTASDRIVANAVKVVLEAIWSPSFSVVNAMRGRTISHALRNVMRAVVVPTEKHVVRTDIQRFFDHISRSQLLEQHRVRIRDQTLLNLIGRLNNRGRRSVGISQGCPLSPLQANIFLNRLDHMLDASPAFSNVIAQRWADDILMVVYGDQRRAQSRLKALRKYVDRVLHLRLNASKTEIRTPEEGVQFLGIRFRVAEGRKVLLSLSDDKLEELRQIAMSAETNKKMILTNAVKDRVAHLREDLGNPEETIAEIATEVLSGIPKQSSGTSEAPNTRETNQTPLPVEGEPVRSLLPSPGDPGRAEDVTRDSDPRKAEEIVLAFIPEWEEELQRHGLTLPAEPSSAVPSANELDPEQSTQADVRALYIRAGAWREYTGAQLARSKYALHRLMTVCRALEDELYVALRGAYPTESKAELRVRVEAAPDVQLLKAAAQQLELEKMMFASTVAAMDDLVTLTSRTATMMKDEVALTKGR